MEVWSRAYRRSLGGLEVWMACSRTQDDAEAYAGEHGLWGLRHGLLRLLAQPFEKFQLLRRHILKSVRQHAPNPSASVESVFPISLSCFVLRGGVSPPILIKARICVRVCTRTRVGARGRVRPRARALPGSIRNPYGFEMKPV